MTLENTTGGDDAVLTQCEEFGGVAADAAAIAERLDEELGKAKRELETMEDDLKEAREDAERLQAELAEMA